MYMDDRAFNTMKEKINSDNNTSNEESDVVVQQDGVF
jgi:hypothetical protein